ncbi:hypothetical protein [Acidiphilium sp.]|uniref:hypothetical protein n=1 Tax=Acidiphilium sp. TaxID=527 RepID=UPI00258BEBF4|nr:hypothetical protein [Acidiphilium sp.]
MGAMLAKASEPVEMLPVKPGQQKTEKTRPGNPNCLTLRQHVFPTKSISRFGNQNGLISVHDLVRNRIFNAKPTNVIFCADRAWDQRTEREMKTIEDKFQCLIAPVVAGLSKTIPQEQREIVDQMYALWFMRPRYRELTQQEIQLHGGVGSTLTKDQEENLETNGYLFVREGGAMPARQLNGLQIMLRIHAYARDLEKSITRWGVIEAQAGEFIVPDVPFHAILPITPRLALVNLEQDGQITEQNLSQINQAMKASSQSYFFARDLSKCLL